MHDITRLSRRGFLQMAAITATGTTLAACIAPTPGGTAGQSSAGQEPQTVRIMYFFGETDPRRLQMDKILEEYSAASDRYKAEAMFAPFANTQEKVQAGIAAGDPPEVVASTGNDGGSLGLEGQAMALDDYFDNSSLPAWTEENWVGYTIAKWSNTGLDGRKYGIPLLPDTRFLFIDVAAFEEVGLDPNQPPVTWDDLETYADSLDKGQPGAWDRVGFCPRWGNSYFMNWSFTTNLFMWDTLDADGIPVLDRPEVREIIEWYVHWRDRYGLDDLNAFAATFSGTADVFISGANPMHITGSWMPARYAQNFPDAQINYALHPKAPGDSGIHASWGAGHCLLMPTNNRNPDGGWNLIEFIFDKERMTEWIIGTGTFVGRLDAMADPRLETEVGKHWPIAVEQLSRTRTADSQYGAWPTLECHNAMTAVWDGQQTIDEALAERQTLIKQQIADWRVSHPDVPYEPDLGFIPS